MVSTNTMVELLKLDKLKEIKNMKTTIEQRKEKAVELMKQLQIYKPYINDFKKDNLVTYFERHIGYWAFQNKELNNKIKQLEEKYNITIYTATHEFCDFGECYSFLYTLSFPSWSENGRKRHRPE